MNRTKWLIIVALLAAGSLQAPAARAQSAKVQALALVREAMDAYNNLDLDGAQAKLEEALGLASQLEKDTLARVYISLGVLWIGGFADNAQGQQNFTIALCLDGKVMVDPLLSTPEIDIVFSLAKGQSDPANCQGVLQGVAVGGGGGGGGPEILPPTPGVPSCGDHMPPAEQKQKYELPIYIEPSADVRPRLARLVAKYAFDSGGTTELVLNPAGMGYGGMITCDEGQIRIFDPASISYHIEGYDRMGQLLCADGSAASPFVIGMMPDAQPLMGFGAGDPKECAPCPPWDDSCGKAEYKPGLGDGCNPSVGCDEGLICGESGLCEVDETGGGGGAGGPATFYTNLGVGAGFGYLSKKIEYRRFNEELGAEGELEEVSSTPAGMAWSGVPIRLALGFFVIDDLSLEATVRFDAYVTTNKEPQSCREAADSNGLDYWEANCQPEVAEGDEEAADLAVGLTDDDTYVNTTSYQVAWLANIRARYRLLNEGGLQISVFLGVGYGFIKYRVPDPDDTTRSYFPMPGMVDIELGPGLAYYFSDNVGLIVEVPIDVIVGDGLAFNFDLSAGLSFGF